MRNVTVSLPEDTVRWLRVEAAKADRSVSGWLADLLDKMRLQDDEYEAAMERCLAIEPRKFSGSTDASRPVRSCMTGPVFVDTNVLVYRRPLTAKCC